MERHFCNIHKKERQKKRTQYQAHRDPPDSNKRRWRRPRSSATLGYEESPKILIKDPQMLHNISSAWHVDANVMMMIITLCFVYNSDTVYEFKPPMNLKQPRPDSPCS